jgi:hypothetical protein
VPEVRNTAPVIFRARLHALALELAAVPATSNEPTYCSTARTLAHVGGMQGHARLRAIRALERQLAGELFAAIPASDSAPLLRRKA